MQKLACASALLGLVAACSDSATPAMATDPDTAPVASVDRFQDGFATLFKRSAPVFNPTVVKPLIPAANAPIDFDQLFTVKALGPDGVPLTYYSFDIVPPKAVDGYVFVDANGATVAGQLPIVDTIPGDAGYTDFVKLTKVHVKAGYVANSLTGTADVMAAVDDGSVTLEPTMVVQDWAVVPKGSTATKKFLGKVPTGHRAWYDGQVASFMLFDESLQLLADGTVPDSPIIVIFHNNMSPAAGFEQDADGQTHNVVATLPGQPTYSSYWDHSVGDLAGYAGVTDLATAEANIMAPNVGVIVNCPVVVAP